MKMEAILAKTVSGRIASVLILYQVAQKPKVYLVLLHLEALSSPEIMPEDLRQRKPKAAADASSSDTTAAAAPPAAAPSPD